MRESLWAAALGSAGAVIGAAGAYLAKRRTTSGSVQSSEAKELWAEGSAIREVLRADLVSERAEVDRLERQVEVLRKENGELWAKLRAREGRP